jgi:hypothetical protein
MDNRYRSAVAAGNRWWCLFVLESHAIVTVSFSVAADLLEWRSQYFKRREKHQIKQSPYVNKYMNLYVPILISTSSRQPFSAIGRLGTHT